MAPALLLAGCGKMGSALLDGWVAAGQFSRVIVVDPGESAKTRYAAYGQVLVVPSVQDISTDTVFDAVVLAVKPQIMDTVAPQYVPFVKGNTVALSIAAGKTLQYFEDKLGKEAAIVRSMPNTPAAVGHGMTVACGNARTTSAQRDLCDQLLRAVGDVAWVEDEDLLDAVTAVSGSGPAYVFLLVEVLAQAGVRAGLPEDLAMQLARATVTGSGELLRCSSEPASVLRENVTSPGGTTKAALDVLIAADGLQSVFDRAIDAATRRSRELAQ